MKKAKSKKTPSPYFKPMVDHIDSTWRARKCSDEGYPFCGRDFKDLQHFARYYREVGVMALWDLFLETGGKWVEKTGYSLQAFFKCLPSLVDKQGWKVKANQYEAKIVPPIEEEVEDLFKDWKIKTEVKK